MNQGVGNYNEFIYRIFEITVNRHIYTELEITIRGIIKSNIL